MKKLLFVLCLILCFIMSSISISADVIEQNEVANPDNFYDIKGHWAESELRNIINYGIMNGTSEDTASPDSYITRAEMCALMTRSFGASQTTDLSSYIDINNSQWFYEYVSRAVKMGIISGNGNSIEPYGNITREDAALVFYRAFNLSNQKANLGEYYDSNDISYYASDAISACVGAGILQGNNFKLEPKKQLTRAEFAVMMNRAAKVYINDKVPFNGNDVDGSMLITVPNITINGITVSKNVYIGEGVGVGPITFNNVQVGDIIYVRGGSDIILRNNTIIDKLVICNSDSLVTINVDATSFVDNVYVEEAVGTVSIRGNVGAVTVNKENQRIDLSDSSIRTLTSNVKITDLITNKSTEIKNIYLSDKASESKLTIDAEVDKIEILGEKIEFDIQSNAKIDNLNVTGSSNIISVSGDIDTFNFGGTDNKVKLLSGCKIDDMNYTGNNFIVETNNSIDEDIVTYDINKANKTLAVNGDSFSIGDKADNSKFTFTDDTQLTELIIRGDNVTVTLNKGATITNIIVYGDYFDLKGKGKVTKVQFKKDTSGGNIQVNSVDVVNDSNTTVEFGDNTLPGNTTGKIDEDGHGTYTDKNNNVISSSNNNSSNNNSSSSNNGSGISFTESKIDVSFASSLNPSEIYYTGEFNVDNFVQGFGYNDGSRKFTGTVKRVNNFQPMANAKSTGYYVPMVLQSSDRTDSFTLNVCGKTYTSGDIVNTSGYGRAVIFFVALDPLTGDKKVNITYDADGSGSNYSQITISLDYSEVRFSGDGDVAERVKLVTGAPAFSETSGKLEVSSMSTSLDRFVFNMKSDSISKSFNNLSVEAFWGGVKVYGPSDAVSYVFTDSSGTYKFVDLSSEEVEGKTYKYFYRYYDMETTQTADFTVTWLNSGDTALCADENYLFNFNNVILKDGDNNVTQKPADGKGETPICATITVTPYLSDILVADIGKTIEEFASDYDILNTADKVILNGTYHRVIFDKDSSGNNVRPDGYYAPLLVTLMDIESDCKLYVNNTLLKNINVQNGESQAIYILAPLSINSNTIQDFVISIKPVDITKYKNMDKNVSCAQADLDDSSLTVRFLNEDDYSIISPTIYVNTAKEYNIVRISNGYELNMELKEAYAAYNSIFKSGYFAPIRLTNLSNSGNDVTVEVTSYSNYDANFTYTDYFGYNQDYIDLLIPVAIINENEVDSESDDITIHVNEVSNLSSSSNVNKELVKYYETVINIKDNGWIIDTIIINTSSVDLLVEKS